MGFQRDSFLPYGLYVLFLFWTCINQFCEPLTHIQTLRWVYSMELDRLFDKTTPIAFQILMLKSYFRVHFHERYSTLYFVKMFYNNIFIWYISTMKIIISTLLNSLFVLNNRKCFVLQCASCHHYLIDMCSNCVKKWKKIWQLSPNVGFHLQ